jgi:hypothetical protein
MASLSALPCRAREAATVSDGRATARDVASRDHGILGLAVGLRLARGTIGSVLALPAATLFPQPR